MLKKSFFVKKVTEYYNDRILVCSIKNNIINIKLKRINNDFYISIESIKDLLCVSKTVIERLITEELNNYYKDTLNNFCSIEESENNNIVIPTDYVILEIREYNIFADSITKFKRGASIRRHYISVEFFKKICLKLNTKLSISIYENMNIEIIE